MSNDIRCKDIPLEVGMRLVTKNGHVFTNARIIGKSNSGFDVMTDCFNTLHMSEERIRENFELGHEEIEGHIYQWETLRIPVEEFIQDIEENIAKVKERLKDGTI